jgi:lysophospholipase L1-like esterase
MKHVLCYGDSNTWGCMPVTGPEPPRRLAPHRRWPGVLGRELGGGYRVVEEGLNGRTTVRDDPLEPYVNGRALLAPALLSHQPLDLVVLMLGTNDLKHRFDVSPAEIAEGAGLLADDARASGCGPEGDSPGVLLVCPPPLARLSRFAEEFEGGADKSRRLPRHYRAVAVERGCAFLDAGLYVTASDVDGVHLDAEGHALLGAAVAAVVREALDP